MSVEVGFTGSRETPTANQVEWLSNLLSNTAISRLHHGDCVGADALAHDLCLMHGIDVLIHPPTDDRLRAFCLGNSVAPKPYLERNKDIVDASVLLIAMPHEPEYPRSGTWSTVRYARSLGRSVAICPLPTTSTLS
jgi:hypothetical protein